eukprot:4174787-Alexandrium_andersonii.AAC.1
MVFCVVDQCLMARTPTHADLAARVPPSAEAPGKVGVRKGAGSDPLHPAKGSRRPRGAAAPSTGPTAKTWT